MDEETLNAFATKIAVHCQKTARGIKARDKAQIKRWERANIAAYRIQVLNPTNIVSTLIMINAGRFSKLEDVAVHKEEVQKNI